MKRVNPEKKIEVLEKTVKRLRIILIIFWIIFLISQWINIGFNQSVVRFHELEVEYSGNVNTILNLFDSRISNLEGQVQNCECIEKNFYEPLQDNDTLIIEGEWTA